MRSKVHDPERVSGHMFRMAVMAMVMEEVKRLFQNCSFTFKCICF